MRRRDEETKRRRDEESIRGEENKKDEEARRERRERACSAYVTRGGRQPSRPLRTRGDIRRWAGIADAQMDLRGLMI